MTKIICRKFTSVIPICSAQDLFAPPSSTRKELQSTVETYSCSSHKYCQQTCHNTDLFRSSQWFISLCAKIDVDPIKRIRLLTTIPGWIYENFIFHAYDMQWCQSVVLTVHFVRRDPGSVLILSAMPLIMILHIIGNKASRSHVVIAREILMMLNDETAGKETPAYSAYPLKIGSHILFWYFLSVLRAKYWNYGCLRPMTRNNERFSTEKA